MVTKKDVAVGALVAGVAGYLAGILTAPKSGKETRQDIKNAAAKAKKEAERRLKDANAELNELIRKAGELAEQTKGKASAEFEKIRAQAVEVRQKTREVLSAIHEGEADDDDLQNAVDEVNKATEHLQKYFDKKSV